MKDRSPYGTCVICGYVGSIERHHLFRKQLRTAFKRRGIKENKITIGMLNAKRTQETKRKISINAWIFLCKKCHRKMHPENYWYQKIEDMKQKASDEQKVWTKEEKKDDIKNGRR
jgi:5-methylcytosine-specific restriction endonuclease McrA